MCCPVWRLSSPRSAALSTCALQASALVPARAMCAIATLCCCCCCCNNSVCRKRLPARAGRFRVVWRVLVGSRHTRSRRQRVARPGGRNHGLPARNRQVVLSRRSSCAARVGAAALAAFTPHALLTQSCWGGPPARAARSGIWRTSCGRRQARAPRQRSRARAAARRALSLQPRVCRAVCLVQARPRSRSILEAADAAAPAEDRLHGRLRGRARRASVAMIAHHASGCARVLLVQPRARKVARTRSSRRADSSSRQPNGAGGCARVPVGSRARARSLRAAAAATYLRRIVSSAGRSRRSLATSRRCRVRRRVPTDDPARARASPANVTLGQRGGERRRIKNKNQTKNTNCVNLVAEIADGHVVGSRSRDRNGRRLRRRRSGRILGSMKVLKASF